MAATSAPDALVGARATPSAAAGGGVSVRQAAREVPWLCAGAAALLWPALWNGYPIVFADTGTYLTQAMRLYAGWDRPPVYSVLLRALHWDRSLWPPVAAQALLVAGAVRLALPQARAAAACAALSVGTAAGVVASRLLPDVFAGVIVILLLVPLGAAWPARRAALCAAGTGVLIATHQSYLPVSAAVLLAALAFYPWRRVAAVALAPVVAAALLAGINAAAFKTVSVSPFGAVFLLARAIEDGPARDVLARECPESGWRLCGRALPATADAFLWRPGALTQAGGAKAVAAEAETIVARAWAVEPGTMAVAFAANTMAQAVAFEPGDGLDDWAEFAPALDGFPPDQAAAFRASRQASGRLAVPRWLRGAQAAVAAASVAVLAWRASRWQAWAALVLVALAANAAVTGGLSGPHARYGSRILWVAPLVACLPARRGDTG